MPYTFLGLQYALKGTGTPNGGIANLATAVKLYASSSTPAKDGTGFTEVSNGNGYTTGGNAITTSNWTFTNDGTNGNLQLADQTWTASGGNIANVLGAYITDTSGNVLAWWPRTAGAVTQSPPDSVILDDLILRIVA